MDLWIFALLGSAGGLLDGLLELHRTVQAWQLARRDAARANPPISPPRLLTLYDPRAQLAAVATQVVLGCLAGLLFGSTGQIAGPYGALVVGASAPTLLSQLGGARLSSGEPDSPAAGPGTAAAAASPTPPSVTGVELQPAAAAPSPQGTPHGS